ncbi:12540_t:CDS:2 [Funneliformis caledonium]|uniref:12540_t:CDS:1 n=1 Tax=Funneliformis caledonium TaxID=1117310 RepID=A0A9N9DGU9_9GLOM|nr:12540_t:CDS:2 [Funneliformis caledonium]
MGIYTKSYCLECEQALVSKYDVSEVGTVYTANWEKGPKDCWDETESRYVARRELIKIALHSLGNSPSLFLKELKLHYFSRVHNGLMIRLFGVTRETVTGHFMMVAETIEWDLRHYVSHHFARLTWSRKLSILHSIACALEQLHNGEQVHRDKATNGQFFKNHLEIPKQSDEFERAERIRIRRMRSKGLDTSPNTLLTPPQIHRQAIYTSRKLKFPIIPLNAQKILRNTTTYEDQSSTIDLASLKVKDQSFFTKSNCMQRKLEEEEIDEDIARQYELSIPFELPIVISS